MSASLAAALEEPDCPGCGASEREVAFAPAAFQPYAVVRCAHCRLHFLSPRPSAAALGALYAGLGYFEGGEAGYDDYRAQEPALRLTFRRFLNGLAARGLAGGSLLEVGCGLGFLLDEARGHFAHREGCELVPAAAVEAAKCCDAVHVGGIDAVPDGARFDCVLSSHVIEHVADPKGFLRAQIARLRPGGTLVAATPWMGSAWQLALGARWPSFKLPEHLLYFDRENLLRLFRALGLERVRTLPYPHAFPLSLVARKLGLRLGGRLGRIPLWIPQTTLAVQGRRPRSEAASAEGARSEA